MTPELQEYKTQIKNKLQKVKGHSSVIFVAASLRRIEDSHFLSGLNFSLFLSLLSREKKGIE